MLDKIYPLIALSITFAGNSYCLDSSLFELSTVSLGLSRDPKPLLPKNVFPSIQYSTELIASFKIGYAPFYKFHDNNFPGNLGICIDAEIGVDGFKFDLGGMYWLKFYEVPLYRFRTSGSWLRKWDGDYLGSNFYGVNNEFGIFGGVVQLGYYRNSKKDNIILLGIGLGL